VGRDGDGYSLICISEKQKYFCRQDWTGQISLIRLDKFGVTRKSTGSQQRSAEARPSGKSVGLFVVERREKARGLMDFQGKECYIFLKDKP
jgi:hypothetical protein